MPGESKQLRGKPLAAYSEMSRNKRSLHSGLQQPGSDDDDEDSDIVASGLGRRKRTRLAVMSNSSSSSSLLLSNEVGSSNTLRQSSRKDRKHLRMSLPARLSSSRRVNYNESMAMESGKEDDEDEDDLIDVQSPAIQQKQTPEPKKLKRQNSNDRLNSNASPAADADNHSSTAREERPFTDFFPDLSTEKHLPLIRYNPTPAMSRDEDVTMTESSNEAVVDDKRGMAASSSSSSSVLFNKLSNLVYTFVERVSSPMSGSAPISQSRTPIERPVAIDDNEMKFASTSHNSHDDESTIDPELPRFIDLEPRLQGPVLHPKHPETIPKCEYEKLDSASADNIPTSVALFERSERLFIRYSQPTEEELENKVEYDLDEQDVCWLEEINKQRQNEELAPIPVDFLELVIDMLEKEWFGLTKDIARHTEEPLSHEDSLCNICGDSEVDNSNAIVFCDGCNLAVHQECYGVPYIPEGQWLCRKCMVAPEKPVSCIFCPHKDGAFKQTTTNKWAHLLCTLWIPEVYVSNPVYMEPVEGVDKIPKSRWKLVCSICKQKGGACIQCCKSTCFTAYHVTCARKAGYYMKSKTVTSGGEQSISYKSFCLKHEPTGPRPSIIGAADGTDSEVDVVKVSAPVETSKRKKKKTSIISLNSPVIPQIALQNVIHRLDSEKMDIRKRNKFIIDVCKYWSLKRRQRRGAPLLKRLHLEPWTAFSSHIKQSEDIQIQRVKILNYLRDDLETTRTLTDLCLRRERKKLQSVKNYISLLQLTLSPLTHIMQKLLDDLKATDKHKVFWFPVSAKDVPDYYVIVKNPICFETIQSKVHDFEYSTLQEFSDDLNLLISNALLYNKRDSFIAKLALKLQQKLEILIEQAGAAYASLPLDTDSQCLIGEFPLPYPGYSGDSYKLISPKIEEIIEEEVEEESSSRSETPLETQPDTLPKPSSKQKQQKQKPVRKSKFPKIDADLVKSIAEYIKQGGSKPMYWCKTEGFPWFPAELIDKPSKEDDIPQGILDMKKNNSGKVFRFLDRDMLSKRTWTYLEKDRFVACDFGQSDIDMLKACIKRVKSPIIKKQAFIGYLAGVLARGKDPIAVFEAAGVEISSDDFKMFK